MIIMKFAKDVIGKNKDDYFHDKTPRSGYKIDPMDIMKLLNNSLLE